MRTSVGGTSAPVVTYIVENVSVSGGVSCSVESSAETPVTSLIVSKQVVVVAAGVTANGRRKAVLLACPVVGMVGGIECLGYKSTLEGYVL